MCSKNGLRWSRLSGQATPRERYSLRAVPTLGLSALMLACGSPSTEADGPTREVVSAAAPLGTNRG